MSKYTAVAEMAMAARKKTQRMRLPANPRTVSRRKRAATTKEAMMSLLCSA